MVWLTPQMDGLFREGAGGRRRFPGSSGLRSFDPEHSARSNAYEHALRERARLLKNGRGDKAWYEALEDSMARHGVAIAVARLAMVERLQQACEAAEGPFPKALLALEGAVEQWLREGQPALCGRGPAARRPGRKPGRRTRRPAARPWDRTAATWRRGMPQRTLRPPSARPASRKPC